jgi:hypothetical protein
VTGARIYQAVFTISRMALLCLLLVGCQHVAGSQPENTAIPTQSVPTATVEPDSTPPQGVVTKLIGDDARQTALATRVASGTPYMFTPFPIPTTAPQPTPILGIAPQCGEADKDFQYGSCWSGLVNSEYLFVTSGGSRDNRSQGLLLVVTSTLDLKEHGPLQTYETPTHAGRIQIAQVTWPRMTLLAAANNGPAAQFAFNLLTRTWETAGPCPLAPVALHSDLFRQVELLDVVTATLTTAGGGSLGWLSWTGDSSDAALARSFNVPGNSQTYINPDNPADHTLAAGKWVYGRNAVSNNQAVVQAIRRLNSDHFLMVVPIWDQVGGAGNMLRYHVSGFGWVSIINTDLTSSNQLTVRYRGAATCPPSP